MPAARPVPGDWPAGCQAYPASFAQVRLWFLHQLEPGLSAYHLPLLWRLRGRLDITAFAQALASLVERHAPLRTSFRMVAGELLQIIHPAAAVPLQVERLGDRQEEEVCAAWLEQERRSPLDLTAGLLLRARLLAVAPEEHLLLLNHHHIASDGWSCAVLARDLSELYNAHRAGRLPDLPPLTLRYFDHAVQQRQRLSGTRLKLLQDHWNSQLARLEPLAYPTDWPSPSHSSHQGGSVAFAIEASQLEPFEALCRSVGATLQTGLVALLALLLHRYSGQDDFVIGIPIWGRSDPASWRRADPHLAALIGCFVNTLPIRIRFRHGQTFMALLRQVRDTSLQACDHAELPMEQMVQALQSVHRSGRNPLLQVMLQLLALPPRDLDGLDGMVAESLPTPSLSARFDLEFSLRRSGSGLQGAVHYAVDLFSPDRIQRLTTHLLTLLNSVLQAPDAPAAGLRLLPGPERQQIESWQQGPVMDVPELCVHEMFERQVERSPDAIALVFQDEQITYGELNARANRLAHHLIELGVGPEVIVAVCLERSVELVVALLAILKAGGAYLPLDPRWPQERRQLLLREAGCWMLIDGEEPVLMDSPRAASPQAETSAASLAYVSYTSGSTGIPKGVAITHASILRLVDGSNGFCVSPGARVLQLAPLAFDASTFEVWGPLLNGGTLVMAPPGQLSPAELAALLRENQITTLWLTAGLFHAMVESERQTLAGVRQVLAGGDVLSPESVQRLLEAFPTGHELINGYGPTENTTFTCCHRLAAGSALATSSVPIGRPIAATVVRVLEASGQPCPIGIPGELHIGGAGLARGYLNKAELTAERFIPDPFSSEPSARLYRSGDLASWNSDGSLAFHGRIDQQIKLRGFRIEPGEIESHLLAHPGVAQAAVMLGQEDPANPRLVAYWVPSDGASSAAAPITLQQLRSFLSERLPEYMVPAALVELAALPLTSNGKLDRRALPAPSFSGDQEQRIEPSTELERQLHALWAEVLGHGEFGVSDNFFLVGGHSLAAARLVSRMEQQFGRRLPLSELFHQPTLRDLSRRLDAADTPASVSGFSSLVTLQPRGEAPPLFVVHGGNGDVYIHLHLARCLAPHRPVHGLQAVGFDGSAPRHRSVDEMAAHYADEILRFQPDGPYHLLGYSGGGWYAWAVAAELHRRGATPGLIGLVDTGSTADLHRRLRLRQLVRRQLQLLPRRARSLAAADLSRWPAALNRKLRALEFITWTLLRPQGSPAPQARNATARPRPTQPLRGDYFLQLHTYYRPPRLPLRTDVFAARSRISQLQKLWNFYARGRSVLHPFLEDHTDYYNGDWMAEFAHHLEGVLTQIETGSSP